MVIAQMNGRNYSSRSAHCFHVGKTKLKLGKGWITKARDSYSKSMQVLHEIIIKKIVHSRSNSRLPVFTIQFELLNELHALIGSFKYSLQILSDNHILHIPKCF